MNPNSAHQLWSRWTTTIIVPFHRTHTGDAFTQEMRATCARFYRTLFGLATELKITRECLLEAGQSCFQVDCRTEGAPAPAADFRQRQMAAIAAFFGKNLQRYGQVDVRVDVRIEAGDEGDGKPPAQLVLGPPVALLPRMTLIGQR